jgi:hypothetical protein
MTASAQPQSATRMFARVLGPFLVIVDIVAVVRAPEMRALVTEFAMNPLYSWVAGAFILLFGLIVIAGHQYWQGFAAIVVSLLGWLIALRGLLLLAFPNTLASLADSMIRLQASWIALCIVFALIGAYLTYAGWISPTSRPTPKQTSATPDLPRAA